MYDELTDLFNIMFVAVDQVEYTYPYDIWRYYRKMNHNIDKVILVSRKFMSLPHEIYEENLKEIVRNVLKLSNNEYEIKYSEGSSKGDNYIGIIYRAEIIYENSTKMSIIVKLPPNNPARREEYFLHRSFVHEADFYEKLYPMYKDFQEKQGVNIEKDGFYQIPFCYKALKEEPLEGLYVEDLKAYGFEVFDRSKELSREHVFLVMRVLAKMHATFYCIKQQNPDLIDEYRKRNDYFIMRCERKGSLRKSWFEESKQKALEVINKCGNSDLIDRVHKLLSQDILILFKNCLDIEATEPYATLCHGDCWNNNIMYQYNKDGLPIDIRFLDFQIMRYASPICDLMYYIFSCTVKPLRDKHYQDFLNVYYDTLSQFIDRLGFESETIFPREAFHNHLKTFGKFALVMGVLVLPVFTSDVNNVPDMDEFVSNFHEMKESEVENVNKNVSYVTPSTYKLYSERLIGVCEDLYNLGYI